MRNLKKFTKRERHKIYSLALRNMNDCHNEYILKFEFGLCYFLSGAAERIAPKKNFILDCFMKCTPTNQKANTTTIIGGTFEVILMWSIESLSCLKRLKKQGAKVGGLS